MTTEIVAYVTKVHCSIFSNAKCIQAYKNSTVIPIFLSRYILKINIMHIVSTLTILLGKASMQEFYDVFGSPFVDFFLLLLISSQSIYVTTITIHTFWYLKFHWEHSNWLRRAAIMSKIWSNLWSGRLLYMVIILSGTLIT